MRNLLFLFIMIMFSCSDKTVVAQKVEREISTAPLYDTIPVDSFSVGAISIDIAAQIRRSTLGYQDSLRKAKADAAQSEQLKKAKEAEAKLNEKKKSAQNAEPKSVISAESKNTP